MAEAVALPLFTTIVGNLASEAFKKKIGRHLGFEEEVEALTKSVSSIEAVLLDAEQQYYKSNQVRVWVQRLKDALHDAEDVLDEISTAQMLHDMRSSQVSRLFSSSRPLFVSLKMAPKIKAVRKKIDDIARDRQFHLELRASTNVRGEGRRRNHGFIRDEEMIGRDDSKNEIIKLLVESDVEENVSIIPLVGIGGLGKTALARCVFNDEKIMKHFALRIWVSVTDVFDETSIMRQIIDSGERNLEIEELLNQTREKIDGKKYFIVLDDMWSENRQEWLSLKSILKGGGRGSKVLVTTRSTLVAEITRTVPRAYILEGLSEETSWGLFTRMAFRQGDDAKDPEFISIGKDIVGKCKGVPLAIRSLGSLLFVKDSIEEWRHIRDQQLSNITQQENDILPILRLSYDHLPSHLKQCFAYCSLFPKDYRISKDDLVRQWMAHGFIQSANAPRHLEDIGEECFMDLVRGNFFQELKKDYLGDVVSFKMHDLMHDVAVSVAGKECTSFGKNAESIDGRSLHVSYESADDLCRMLPICSRQVKKLRTVLCLDVWRTVSVLGAPTIFDKNILRLRCLRFLDLHGAAIQVVPSSISKLKHLRELNLSGNPIEELPSSIVKLQNLQTLTLIGCLKLKELPSGIRKMTKLRHLDIMYCEMLSHMPTGIGELASLQTLSMFVVSGSALKGHARLSELSGLDCLSGSLHIENLGRSEEAVLDCEGTNLSQKDRLRELILSWDRSERGRSAYPEAESMLEALRPHPNLRCLVIRNYMGASFPRWLGDDMIRCIPNLVEIVINNCPNLQHLPALGRLRHLKSMELVNLGMVNCIKDDNSSSLGEFPDVDLSVDENGDALQLQGLTNLRHLTFERTEKLESLPEWLLHMTNLEELHLIGLPDLVALPGWICYLRTLKSLIIASCPKLTSLPEEMSQLRSLEHFEIANCPGLREACAAGTGPDRPLIAHVQRIVIY